MQRGLLDPEREDPFSLFVASTNIRYCYYADTHKILGSTYGMLVLQVMSAVLCLPRSVACSRGEPGSWLGVGLIGHCFHSARQPTTAVARPPHPCPLLIFLPPPAAAACEQDFEAVTPNLLARTVETVEGGGVVVLLLSSLDSLSQLYSLTMDVHSRLRTESHQEVTGERCARCAALGRAGFCCATIVVYAWLF